MRALVISLFGAKSVIWLRSLALVALLVLTGCATRTRTVSRFELERLKTDWYEPRLSTWFYTGSKNGFHYFYHLDMGSDQKEFRISETELPWPDTFPRTSHRASWRRLNWGDNKLR